MENLKPQEDRNKITKKEERWNEIASRVDKITDKIGKPIDKGIRDTVIAFLANNFETTNSCEGHNDSMHKGLYPYIHIEHTLKSPELTKKVNILTEKATEKGYKDVHDIPQTEKELFFELTQLQNEVETYKKEVLNKLNSLLNRFYSFHKPKSPEYRLNDWEGGSFYEISPISGRGVGLDNWEKFDLKKNNMSPKDREIYLKETQAEMRAFTDFLKTQY